MVLIEGSPGIDTSSSLTGWRNASTTASLLLQSEPALQLPSYLPACAGWNFSNPPPSHTITSSRPASLVAASCCDYNSAQYDTYTRTYKALQTQTRYEFDPEHHTAITSTETATYTASICDGPFTVLEDSIPRALCKQNRTTTSISTYLSSWLDETEVIEVTTLPPVPIPPPNCALSPSDCDNLWTEFRRSGSMIAEFYKTSLNTHYDESDTWRKPWPVRPFCKESGNHNCRFRCLLDGYDIQLLHWPITSPGQESTLTHEKEMERQTGGIKQRVIASFGTHILESPTLYAFFPTIHDMMGCGSTHTDVVVPISQTDLSSVRLNVPKDGGTTAWPFNLNDLGYSTINGTLSFPLVPISAYRNQQKCYSLDCDTIYDDYAPDIKFKMYTKYLQTIDPEWKRCNEWEAVKWRVHDPPIALSPITELSIPTMPANMPALPKHSIPTFPERTTTYREAMPAFVPKPTPKTYESEIYSMKPETHVLGAEFTIHGRPYTALEISPGTLAIAGKIVSAHGSHKTIDGEIVKANREGIIVGGSFQAFTIMNIPAGAILPTPTVLGLSQSRLSRDGAYGAPTGNDRVSASEKTASRNDGPEGPTKTAHGSVDAEINEDSADGSDGVGITKETASKKNGRKSSRGNRLTPRIVLLAWHAGFLVFLFIVHPM